MALTSRRRQRVKTRRCIEEIHKYSLCLQTSACPAPLAKATSSRDDASLRGAPTAAAVTQLVEERVRATGDDEATARAYLTSYDLCALWGDDETAGAVRRPAGVAAAARECGSSHEPFRLT